MKGLLMMEKLLDLLFLYGFSQLSVMEFFAFRKM